MSRCRRYPSEFGETERAWSLEKEGQQKPLTAEGRNAVLLPTVIAIGLGYVKDEFSRQQIRSGDVTRLRTDQVSDRAQFPLPFR